MDTIHAILRRLHDHQVEFVVVGGMAGIIHGSSIVTEDLDICAPFTAENLSRLLAALQDSNPRHRMPTHRPLVSNDPETLATFKNLYIQSDLGQLDILSTIDHVGSYEHVHLHSTLVDLGGLALRVLNLDALIRAKAAISRPKDRQAVAELKALLERHRQQE